MKVLFPASSSKLVFKETYIYILHDHWTQLYLSFYIYLYLSIDIHYDKDFMTCIMINIIMSKRKNKTTLFTTLSFTFFLHNPQVKYDSHTLLLYYNNMKSLIIFHYMVNTLIVWFIIGQKKLVNMLTFWYKFWPFV